MLLEMKAYSHNTLAWAQSWTCGASEVRAALDRVESALMARSWTLLRTMLEYEMKLYDMEAVL